MFGQSSYAFKCGFTCSAAEKILPHILLFYKNEKKTPTILNTPNVFKALYFEERGILQR